MIDYFSCCNHLHWYYKVRDCGSRNTHSFNQIDLGDCLSQGYSERQNHRTNNWSWWLLSRETRSSREKKTNIHYKQLDYTIMLAGKSKISGVSWRFRRAEGAGEVWSQSAGEFPLALLKRSNHFFLIKPSSDRTGTPYGGDLLYSKFTDLNVNLVRKYSRLTHKMNHHRNISISIHLL